MGYTHYWNKKNRISDRSWSAICEDSSKILAGSSDVIKYERDEEKPPEVSEAAIRFNGIEDEGHETFFLEPGPSEFAFCKTAMKPYDKYVTAVLCVAAWHAGEIIGVSSDGDPDDWKEGLKLAKAVIPEAEIPSGVRSNRLWEGGGL